MEFSFYVTQKNKSHSFCCNNRLNKWCFGWTVLYHWKKLQGVSMGVSFLTKRWFKSRRRLSFLCVGTWQWLAVPGIPSSETSSRTGGMTSPSAEDIPSRAAGVRITLHQTHARPVWASVGVCDHRDVHLASPGQGHAHAPHRCLICLWHICMPSYSYIMNRGVLHMLRQHWLDSSVLHFYTRIDSPHMPYFLNIASDVSQTWWYHTIILYHTWNFNLTHARSLPASLSEPLLTSWVSSICGLQLHYGVTNWQLLGSAGSHPAVIVFKLCCCTNKHMGACRTMSRTPTRLQSHYTLSEVQVKPTHHSSLLLKELPSQLNVYLQGQNNQCRSWVWCSLKKKKRII